MTPEGPKDGAERGFEQAAERERARPTRRTGFEVFEARASGAGDWDLDEASLRGPTWLDRLKQVLLVIASVAIVASVWVFALALALVLAPVVLLAAWWMWRRLRAKLRAQASGQPPGGHF